MYQSPIPGFVIGFAIHTYRFGRITGKPEVMVAGSRSSETPSTPNRQLARRIHRPSAGSENGIGRGSLERMGETSTHSAPRVSAEDVRS